MNWRVAVGFVVLAVVLAVVLSGSLYIINRITS